MKRAIVDFGRVTGRIRPQHCISYAFRGGRGFVGEFHRALGAEEQPFSHMRKFAIGYGKSVEIPYIFRNFDADANDPASYYFPQTDESMEDFSTYAKNKIYTLGAPRELFEPHIYCTVPKDYEKWAEVACNIVRHYNEGLWDGYRYGIGYLEIWDSPDMKGCWDGTPEEYYALYEVAARAIKRMDPTLKVGGASFALADERGFGFLEGFLRFVTERGLPLDFVTFKAFDSDPNGASYRAARVRGLLLAYGLSPEIFLTGYGCVDEAADQRERFRHLRDMRGACYLSGTMMEMQRQGIDASILFDMRTDGMYTAVLDWYGDLQKPAYALFAYKELYDLGAEVATSGHGLSVLASKGDAGRAAILVSVDGGERERCEILARGLGAFRATYKTLDGGHDLSVTKTEEYGDGDAVLAVEAHGESVFLIEIETL